MEQIKILKLLILLIIPSLAFSKENHLMYYLPPKADSIVEAYLSSWEIKQLKEKIVFAVLKREQGDTFNITISYINKRNSKKDYRDLVIEKTNRVINIKNKFSLPVFIEDYDGLLMKPNYQVDMFGNTMHDVNAMLYHSFYMTFTLGNKITKLSNGYGHGQ